MRIKAVFMYRRHHSPVNIKVLSGKLLLHWPQKLPAATSNKNLSFRTCTNNALWCFMESVELIAPHGFNDQREGIRNKTITIDLCSLSLKAVLSIVSIVRCKLFSRRKHKNVSFKCSHLLTHTRSIQKQESASVAATKSRSNRGNHLEYPEGPAHYPNLFGMELHYFAISTQSPNPFYKADSPVQCVLLGDCIHDRDPMFFITSNARSLLGHDIYSGGRELKSSWVKICNVSSVQLGYSFAFRDWIRRSRLGLPRHVTVTDIEPLCILLRSTKGIGTHRCNKRQAVCYIVMALYVSLSMDGGLGGKSWAGSVLCGLFESFTDDTSGR